MGMDCQSLCMLIWSLCCIGYTCYSAITREAGNSQEGEGRGGALCFLISTAAQRQTAVTADLKSQQLLLFAFARQHRRC